MIKLDLYEEDMKELWINCFSLSDLEHFKVDSVIVLTDPEELGVVRFAGLNSRRIIFNESVIKYSKDYNLRFVFLSATLGATYNAYLGYIIGTNTTKRDEIETLWKEMLTTGFRGDLQRDTIILKCFNKVNAYRIFPYL